MSFEGFYDMSSISTHRSAHEATLIVKFSLLILRHASKNFEVTLDLIHFIDEFFSSSPIRPLEISHFILRF